MAAVRGKVLKASGLKNVDLWGKSDPFVHVTLLAPDGSVKGEMKTATKTDDLDPVYENEVFNFACADGDFIDYNVLFKVMDTGLGPDVELGEALVPVKLIPLLPEGGEPTVFDFSLGIKRGHTSLGMISVMLGVIPHAGWFG